MKTLLFSAEGEELYLRNPASFNIPYGTRVEQIADFNLKRCSAMLAAVAVLQYCCNCLANSPHSQ
jgi:hypothetical protein